MRAFNTEIAQSFGVDNTQKIQFSHELCDINAGSPSHRLYHKTSLPVNLCKNPLKKGSVIEWGILSFEKGLVHGLFYQFEKITVRRSFRFGSKNVCTKIAEFWLCATLIIFVTLL